MASVPLHSTAAMEKELGSTSSKEEYVAAPQLYPSCLGMRIPLNYLFLILISCIEEYLFCTGDARGSLFLLRGGAEEKITRAGPGENARGGRGNS